MRHRITKMNTGRSAINRKEVAIRINKSGLSADGEQRFVVAIRFTDNAQKKASSSGYIVVETDDELNRLYFITAKQSEGYKLTASGKNSKFKSITFAVNHIDDWRTLAGDYDMKKDTNDNTYYIDLVKCPEI